MQSSSLLEWQSLVSNQFFDIPVKYAFNHNTTMQSLSLSAVNLDQITLCSGVVGLNDCVSPKFIC